MLKFLTKGFIFTFLIGFCLGALYFFPFAKIKNKVESSLSKNLGRNVRMQKLSFGTGLGLGLRRGGLLAIKAQNATIQIDRQSDLTCKELTITPQIWSLFITQARVAIHCQISSASEFLLYAATAFLFNKNELDIEIESQNMQIDIFKNNLLKSFPLSGAVDAVIEIDNLNAETKIHNGVTWELDAQNMELPDIQAVFINLPSLSFDRLSSQGKIDSKNALSLNKFIFGSKENPLSGQISGQVKLSKSYIPNSGEIKGRLKVQPAYEKEYFSKSLNLDKLFGPIKKGNERIFRKKVTSNPLWILDPPQ